MNEIQSWLDYRRPEDVDVDLDCLPPNGLIVPGVAAFFFTMTDHAAMWVDTFVTNPRAELSARHEAGKVFAACIFNIAKERKIKRMFFLTRNKAIERYYAKLLHAKPVNQFMLYKTEYQWD